MSVTTTWYHKWPHPGESHLHIAHQQRRHHQVLEGRIPAKVGLSASMTCAVDTTHVDRTVWCIENFTIITFAD